MTEQQSPVWFVTGCSTGSEGSSGSLCSPVAGERWSRRAIQTRCGTWFRNAKRVRCQQLDVSDRAKIADAVQRAQEKFGRIDVLVNNAGDGYLAGIEEGEDKQARRRSRSRLPRVSGSEVRPFRAERRGFSSAN